MAKVIILGTANSVPDENHENTHLVVVGSEQSVLIDAVSNPVVRLHQAGVDPMGLTDLVLTHFHPDHVSGVPLLLMDMWLMGRRSPLQVHGLSHTLDRIEALMDLYSWEHWPGFFPVVFHRLPEDEGAPVFENREMKMVASPVKHLIPTIGLRVDFPSRGKSLTYSCDTEPCDAVVRLAAGSDVLIHEATGASSGHSSAMQAGKIARQAQVGALVLIHYPVGLSDSSGLVQEAKQTFTGPVELARDFMVIDLSE